MRSPTELVRWPRAFARPVGAALILAFAAGCAGGGTSVPGTPPQAKSPAGLVPVTFTMHWNSASSSSTVRAPKYVPATALSVSVAVNGGEPQNLNNPATTLVINAPAGTDTFAIATYNSQNGQGTVLSSATVTQVIVDGAANVVTAVLNGVVASIKLTLTNPNFPDGTAATLGLSVVGRDPDGSVIVGSTAYANPITLAVSDTYATLGLSGGKVVGNPSVTIGVSYTGGTLINGTLTASAGPNVTPVVLPIVGVPTVYECPVAGQPQYIAGAKDTSAWYTDSNNTVVRITENCVLTPYTIPTGNANPQGITLGENGNMWFTEYNSSKVAEVTPAGAISEFGTLFGSDSPQMLADRGDGTVWYAGYGGNHVGYVNEYNGVAGETTLPTGGSGPWDVAEAPNGYLYVSENLNDDMARLATLFQSPIPQTPVTSESESESVVLGPDGNLWFTQFGLDHIGVVSPTTFTQIASYATASSSSVPVDITAGLDGALWYTESGLDRIGRMLTNGASGGEYRTLSSNTNVKGIATGSDGSIWFCESNTSKVGRIVY
jgi:virginiamycin B lyase